MKILFRWSIWGDKRKLLELLVCSVDTFRRAFGVHARYVVCTDEPAEISALMHACVEIMPYANEEVGFYVETKSMWRKWCPWPRLDRTCHEFYVDADVFIVSTPTELWRDRKSVV